MNLVNTFWTAFDKKQPDLGKFIDVFTKYFDNKYRSPDDIHLSGYKSIICNFNNHLQKTLTIEMLVAMKDRKVLGKPIDPAQIDPQNEMSNSVASGMYRDIDDYQQAMESVWYEGFEVKPIDDAAARNSVLNSENKSFAKEYDFGFKFFGFETISDMKDQPVTIEFWKEVLK